MEAPDTVHPDEILRFLFYIFYYLSMIILLYSLPEQIMVYQEERAG